jgi:hypothetical protein
VSTDGIAGYTTYRLEVTLGDQADNFYTIFGEPGMDMIIPGAYQVATPFGTDIGGVSPSLTAVMPTATYDSWLTVGITEGGDQISSIGIPFGTWTEQAGFSTNNGALFWMDPTSGPTWDSGPVTVAQLTVPTGATRLDVQMGAQGRSRNVHVDGQGDWMQQLNFQIMGRLGGAPGGGH